MAQKDMTEKILLSYNDVFADVCNVLMFNGKDVVRQNHLYDHIPKSFYKINKKIYEQERDVIKRYVQNNNTVACIGIENQTTVDNLMPVRVIGYDGVNYKDIANNKTLYPFITMILYYGIKRRWRKPTHLIECIETTEDFIKHVKDYEIEVYEIAYLSEEQVKMFQSDFQIVADYFVQKRKTNDYIPIDKEIKHTEAVLQLLSVMSEDRRFIEVYNKQKEKGEIRTMCEVLDRIENRGYIKGDANGYTRGKLEERENSIQVFIETLIELGLNQVIIKEKLKEKYQLNEEEMTQYLH